MPVVKHNEPVLRTYAQICMTRSMFIKNIRLYRCRKYSEAASDVHFRFLL